MLVVVVAWAAKLVEPTSTTLLLLPLLVFKGIVEATSVGKDEVDGTITTDDELLDEVAS